MIGQTICHYKILEKLGEGGMGVVYKAQDTKLDRFVALKFFPPHLHASEQDKARFVQEAKVAAALNHPNICSIIDIQDHDDQMFIVMEFVDGETLRDRKNSLSFKQTIDIGIQIAEGLAAAHGKGIVHRDIKPENIMMRKDGIAQIMDFGLAKLEGVASFTKAGSTIGTTSYMSPEQVQGVETDNRSDIFALGVVLYELFAGRLPFNGAHETAVMYEIVNVDPPKLSTQKPGIDQECERIVMKCLEKDRGERYQSAREVAVDLKRLRRDSEGKQVTRGSVGGGIVTNSSKANSHWTKIAIALGLLALLVVGGKILIRNRGDGIESLAVLPFANASADSSMEYLSDGITESLINSLSQLPKLKVMSRNSVFRFKGNMGDLQSVAQKLGVRAVLVGRVLQHGENLNISTELIDASDNTHLWGEQYNRKYADILVIQGEITNEISQKLSLRLADQSDTHSTKLSTENTEAYQLYLKGRFHWNKRSPDGLRRAIEYFQQAVEKDPNYALAFSGMADAYAVLGWFEYGIVPPQDAYPKAQAAARKAIEIDPKLAEPYASLGLISTCYDYDWPAAEQNYKRALEINPSYPTAHQWYGEYLTSMGRLKEGVAEMKFALGLDPLSLIITRDVGWMLYYARRYDEANEYFRKALELDPNFSRAHLLLGESYIQQGLLDQAIAEFKTAARLSEGTVSSIMIAYCHARAGRIREAKHILDGLLALSAKQYVPAGGIALVYMGLEDRDKAFAWLNKSLEERSGVFAFVKVDPLFDGVRDDPRFVALLKKRGLFL